MLQNTNAEPVQKAEAKNHKMSDKKFRRLIAAVTAAGIASTAALTAYTVYKHVNSSILTYIANER